jgi:FkbM family methyltransferase
MKKTDNRLFIFLRRLSRNTILGNIVPYRVKRVLMAFFEKKKSKEKLLKKTILKHYEESKAYLTENVKASIDFLENPKNGFYSIDFLRIWLSGDEKSGRYFDFNGAKLPDVSHDIVQMKQLLDVFQDTFLFSCLLNDNYNKALVEEFDPFMMEGPYGYVDVCADFDSTIKDSDVVIDAGAWIGDFSAYAVSKGAIVYAFEPVSEPYDILVKTALLNNNKIIPIKKALGNNDGTLEIIVPKNAFSSSIYTLKGGKKETIEVMTLDEFVEKEAIKKVDFIKADVEGGERYLLMGAKKVLKEFNPKLAICTYHFPEDPELLEKIILEINPKYSIIHTRSKLFGMVKK